MSYHACSIDLLELEPLCNEDIICSSMLKGIRTECNRAIIFIGHQGRNLEVVKLRMCSTRMTIESTLESPAASSCPGHLFTTLEQVQKLGTTIVRKILPDLRY